MWNWEDLHAKIVKELEFFVDLIHFVAFLNDVLYSLSDDDNPIWSSPYNRCHQHFK